jgi:hypothetical protein
MGHYNVFRKCNNTYINTYSHNYFHNKSISFCKTKCFEPEGSAGIDVKMMVVENLEISCL